MLGGWGPLSAHCGRTTTRDVEPVDSRSRQIGPALRRYGVDMGRRINVELGIVSDAPIFQLSLQYGPKRSRPFRPTPFPFRFSKGICRQNAGWELENEGATAC